MVLRSHLAASNSTPLQNTDTATSRTPRRSVSPRNDSSSHRIQNKTTTTSATNNSTPNTNTINININQPHIHDDSEDSYDHIPSNNHPPSEHTINPPPNLNRNPDSGHFNANPLSQDEVLRTLRALQARVMQYEQRHQDTQQTIRHLTSRNLALEDELLLSIQRERDLRQERRPATPLDDVS